MVKDIFFRRCCDVLSYGDVYDMCIFGLDSICFSFFKFGFINCCLMLIIEGIELILFLVFVGWMGMMYLDSSVVELNLWMMNVLYFKLFYFIKEYLISWCI